MVPMSGVHASRAMSGRWSTGFRTFYCTPEAFAVDRPPASLVVAWPAARHGETGGAFRLVRWPPYPRTFRKNYFVISIAATIAATAPIIGDGQWRTRRKLSPISQNWRTVVARSWPVISRGSYNGRRWRNDRGWSVAVCTRCDVRRYSVTRCRGHVHRPPCNIDPAGGHIDGLSVGTYNTRRSERHHSEGKRSVTHFTHSDTRNLPLIGWYRIDVHRQLGRRNIPRCFWGGSRDLRTCSVSSNLAR